MTSAAKPSAGSGWLRGFGAWFCCLVRVVSFVVELGWRRSF